ncbi:hypothetical protein [Sphingomonas sp. PP-CC-1A-547]|nr:hypothetical protein [Sphingomonas sp. PP-CC-1A-547]RKE50311.1 hypothetical protein C8J39_1881 [Sphingomonas sp. PP-CC-1A-547]
MGNTDKLFMIFVTLYAVWQLIRVARGVESIASELRGLRAIAEQNRR